MNEFCIIHTDPTTGDRWLTWPGDALPDESREQHIARVVDKCVPKDGRTNTVVDSSQMPSNNGLDPQKMFVDAWVVQNGSVIIDLVIAKRVWLRRLKHLCDARLERINQNIEKAQLQGDSIKEALLEAKKLRLESLNFNQLRNQINAVNTLEELKTITHPDLGD